VDKKDKTSSNENLDYLLGIQNWREEAFYLVSLKDLQARYNSLNEREKVQFDNLYAINF